MAKSKLKAFKNFIHPTIRGMLRPDRMMVFHRVEVQGERETVDGKMISIKIQQNISLNDPSYDVAALIGQAITYLKSGNVNPESPELWYWENSFWMKARTSGGVAYYSNDHTYLFYKVEVENQDELMKSIIS